ncbi:hypothetical protein H5410_021912, partial [Solanum commersonii]
FIDDTTKEHKDIETLKVIEKRIRDVIYKEEDKVDSSLRSIEILLKLEKDVDSLRKEVPQIEFNKHGRKFAKQVLTRKKMQFRKILLLGWRMTSMPYLNTSLPK